MKEPSDAPPFKFMTTNPVLNMLLAEYNLVSNGYSYSEVKQMTLDEMFIRSMVFGQLEFIMENKSHL